MTPAWGEAAEGVRVFLTKTMGHWERSDRPEPGLLLEYEAKNEGNLTLYLPNNGISHQVEVDGQWYEWVHPGVATAAEEPVVSHASVLLDFGPGQSHQKKRVDVAASPKVGMEFLAEIPELRELSHLGLDFTPAQLGEIIRSRSLAVSGAQFDTGDRKTYHIHTPQGESVMVSFRGNKCSGIQRMRPDPEGARNPFEQKQKNREPETDQGTEDGVAWGEAVDGLQAGLTTASDHVRPYQLGQNVPLRFLLRNTTDKPLTVVHARVPVFINWDNYRRPPGPQLFSPDGKQVFPASGVGGRGLPGKVTQTIPPREVICLTTTRLPLRPQRWKGTTVNLLTYVVAPGRHRVSLSHQFDDHGGEHWGGTVTTGPLDLYVHANEKPLSIPGNPWGQYDDSGGVRCRLNTDKTQLRQGEPPILTVDLQNHAQRTVEQIWHGLEFKLEVDGQWTGRLSPTEVNGPVDHLAPQQEWINVPLVLEENGYYMSATASTAGGTPPFSKLLGPGRHTIRVEIDGAITNPVA